MTDSEVKDAMMSLWKDTFNDSDEYISLVFDEYYNSDLVEYEVREDKIVSALLGIPYKFMSGNILKKYNYNGIDELVVNDNCLHGLYLCGLCTDKRYRSEGIMSKLINNINIRAYRLGYSFTFLIPANEGLQKYYKDRNYVSCCYKRYDSYAKKHVFQYDCISDYKFYSLALFDGNYCYEYLCNDVLNYINMNASKDGSVGIYRNIEDIKAILNENYISNGKCIICICGDGNICGIIITHGCVDNNIIVQQIYADNDIIRNGLLQYLQNSVGNHVSITVSEDVDYCSSYSGYKKEFLPYRNAFSAGQWKREEVSSYDKAMTQSLNVKTFAMGRILKLSEVLIFATHLCPGRKYSILVTEDSFVDNCGLYIVESDELTFIPISEMSADELVELMKKAGTDASFYHVTLAELASLFWRNTVELIVEDTIYIPKLPFNISLMLE